MSRVILLAFILPSSLGAFLWFYTHRTKDAESEFKIERVSRGDIVSKVSATGTINPVATVIVGSQVSGKIVAIYADYNSRVRKGQVLAEIDPSLFLAQLQQGRASVETAKANLEKERRTMQVLEANLEGAQAVLEKARRDLQRAKYLYEKSLLSESDMDVAQQSYKSALANVEAIKAQIEAQRLAIKSAENQLKQALANMSIAETNLRYTKIVSPVDGIVITKNVEVGQTVAASFQTPTLFLIAKDLSKMQVEATVSEADIGKIKEGQEVEFTVDAYPGRVFRGRVSQVRLSPVNIQNVITYTVIIPVDNSHMLLKPGMTANVSFLVAKKTGVLRVPNVALRVRLRGEKQQGAGVWALRDNRPVRVPVKTGISDGTYTEVVAGDLKEGDKVIVGLGEERKKPASPRFF
ncbi:efflux RND transporter periplasmic adaptor subunit [Hydrogenobacter thermophilus]|uniref:efflux RND transporter periplasmic adaptor subunit n=1 Tax=Hydrogenobacter thermophilus TaxID=940 RepID=UPI0030FCA297